MTLIRVMSFPTVNRLTGPEHHYESGFPQLRYRNRGYLPLHPESMRLRRTPRMEKVTAATEHADYPGRICISSQVESVC
jgi:hypothetical protein